MADDEIPDSFSLPLVWAGVEELPILAANQLLAQADQDQIYLTFGIAIPPVLSGTDPDKLMEQARQLHYVTTRPLTRLAVSRRHLGQLIEALQQTADNFDQQGASK